MSDPDADADDEYAERAWDAGWMRDVLTQPEAMIDAFSLPRTPDTMAAAARVVAAFKAAADARVAPCHPASVAVIKARLAAMAKRKQQPGADGGDDAATAAFAAETLAALEAVPPRAAQVTHALLVRASAAPLYEALKLESRALLRVLSQPAVYDLSDRGAPLFTPAQLDALFAPLPERVAPSASAAAGADAPASVLTEPRFPRRPVQREVEAAERKETEEWAAAQEAAYEDGTADGAWLGE